MQIIPLFKGSLNAHHVTYVQLGDIFAELSFNYHDNGQWSMDMSVAGIREISGAMLEPNVDIIKNWRKSGTYGRLIFIGEETTLDNLGISNSLIWVPPDE